MAHSSTEEGLLRTFAVDPGSGLTYEQVTHQRTQYGWNEMCKAPGKGFTTRLLAQFTGLTVLTFCVSIVKSEGQLTEPVVVLLLLVVNAVVGLWLESCAGAALEALGAQPKSVCVLRAGQWQDLGPHELVPGDILELSTGDKVPADLRVLQLLTPSLQVDQCTVTDEAKTLCSGSIISQGRALALTTETGPRTELSKQGKAPEYENRALLQGQIEDFCSLWAKFVLCTCALTWVLDFFDGAVTLAVATVPQGLPLVTATCLALCAQRMAERHTIVRRLHSVETLGRATVICSEKTGILTTSEMTVTNFVVPGNSPRSFNSYSVTGHGFSPVGNITGLTPQRFDSVVREFVNCGVLCNDSRLREQGGRVVNSGAPTEGAIRVLCEKIGRSSGMYHGCSSEGFSRQLSVDYQRVGTLEFTRERKMMSVIVRAQGELLMYTKGAPENVLANCTHLLLGSGEKAPLTQKSKDLINEYSVKMSGNSLRCLALAFKTDGAEDSEQGLVFLGLLGMHDPVRPDAKHSVEICKQAGLRVFMVTGDNKLMAEATAKQLGIMNDTEHCASLTGSQFDSLSDAEALKLLSEAQSCVFCRVKPEHKVKLVQLLKALGEVVAMTGDGVTDTPVLQEAHIGLAMGLMGSEAAKAAADMVLADDKFSTIVAAVEQGRSIHNNTKGLVRYLISSSIGKVGSIVLTAVLGLPNGFTLLQLL